MTAIETFWSRYLNEVLGLLVMVLMAAALIAGQAQTASGGIAAAGELRQGLDIRAHIDGAARSDSYEGF